MIYRQYLGIYLDEYGVQSTTFHKFMPGLLPGRRGIVKRSTGTHTTLGRLLESLRPSRKRRIFIALPRRLFFTRCVEFPDLPLDDVRDAVVNSLDLYSHLPLDEIYYDVRFTRIRGRGVTALLYYAPRKKLDGIIQQVRDSGHIRSFECLFPFSHGAGAWVWGGKKAKSGREFRPYALRIPYRDGIELALYAKEACINSFLLDSEAGGDTEGMYRDILADHGLPPEEVVLMDGPDDFGEEEDNMGAVALAPVLAGAQHVSVDANLPRIKLFKPMRIVVPLFLAVIAVAVWMSMEIRDEIKIQQVTLDRVKKEIKAIDRQIGPILEAKEVLEKAAAHKGDVEDFISSKPPLFTYINDLADIVPENTWFAHLAYKPGVISMQGQGDDVLKVVEALRASRKYEEVKVKGSVSRTKEGKDKFNIDLILKEPVDILKGRKGK